MEVLDPKIIVIGEAPSNNIHYYSDYNTITQNSAKDIIFDFDNESVDIYVGSDNYSVGFLDDMKKTRFDNYIGSFKLRKK